MIVKNESDVIQRCLASVKRIIDHWVVVDTGSTDGTQEIVKNFMRDIPGHLYERPWVDFASNRNEALALAAKKADYLLFIDADERLEFSDTFSLPELDKDAYYIATRLPNVVFYRMLLVNNHLKWVWEGVLHEALYSPDANRSSEVLPDVENIATATDGHRSRDPETLQNDVRLLEKALQKDPKNSRTVFFLAQSHYLARSYTRALMYYQKRAAMGGFDEEIYFSLYMIGYLQEKLGMAPEIFLESYQKAYRFRPSRAEPLFRIAHYYHRVGEYQAACDQLKEALSIPLPLGSLNVEQDMYDNGHLLLADCAERLGKDHCTDK
jgi:glycosyltransferase involved in cell wall biosynthesis